MAGFLKYAAAVGLAFLSSEGLDAPKRESYSLPPEFRIISQSQIDNLCLSNQKAWSENAKLCSTIFLYALRSKNKELRDALVPYMIQQDVEGLVFQMGVASKGSIVSYDAGVSIVTEIERGRQEMSSLLTLERKIQEQEAMKLILDRHK